MSDFTATPEAESYPRATVDQAIAAWESKGPTSLTVAMMADALYGARESEASTTVVAAAPESARRCGELGGLA